MFILHKKRIQIMIACVIISLLAFSFSIAKNSKEGIPNNQVEEPNVLPTTATPVSGKTIVIDAGHGTPDERSRK